MDRTNIEWTDATWNPVTGCTKVSPGCDHCYAETLAERFRGAPGHYFERGFDVQLRSEKLDQPLRWRRPRRIFVNSMSDLFHDAIPDEYIARVFAVMAQASQHTFQLLTKRHGRMRSLLCSSAFRAHVADALYLMTTGEDADVSTRHIGAWQDGVDWPLRNVWLGVSVENQQWADIRVPALLDTPAAVRFLSMEPLLGPVRLWGNDRNPAPRTRVSGIDWVIVGGESGRGARPMHPAWARSLRDQCQAAGVPFLFKQWGEWTAAAPDAPPGTRDHFHMRPDGTGEYHSQRYRLGIEHMIRVWKKAAGRELDGRTHNDFPKETKA